MAYEDSRVSQKESLTVCFSQGGSWDLVVSSGSGGDCYSCTSVL